MPLDNALTEWQSQAGANAWSFGREKWFKDAFPQLDWDPWTRIRYLKEDASV